MIAELGHFALILAFLVAVLQAVLPLVGAAQRRPSWMAVAEPAALPQLALTACAFAALMHAYVTSDFSVANVVANSHSMKPLIYKHSSVWGRKECWMRPWVPISVQSGVGREC